MEEQRANLLAQLEPSRVADGMNRGFVGLARALMRVVDWSAAGVTDRGSTDGGAGARRPAKKKVATKPRKEPRVPHVANRAVFLELARTVDRAVRQGLAGSGNALPDEPTGGGSRPGEGVPDARLKDLFHREAGRRLAAARWLRKNGGRSAVATLEGVLRIEESAEVRGEIERAICVLDSCPDGTRS